MRNRIKCLANSINIDLSEKNIDKFSCFKDLLIEWNKKMNLTAITEENDIILKHFIDSLTSLKYIENDKKIIDVGTGAGFPGIPIAIMKENAEITLLDSLNKRLVFLDEVKKSNNLDNVKLVHGRAEDLGQDINFREKYDISISRAVANFSTLSEYLLPFVKIGGKCICMKGPDSDEEIENAKNAINKLGGRIVEIEKFNLPDSDIGRTIIIIEKIKNTPKEFPRKAGIPSREPIK